MHVSARADYGIRALLELAQEYRVDQTRMVTAEAISQRQAIPFKFLEGILRELRQADLVMSQRGADGGYRLARPPHTIAVADALRALDGPLAAVRGHAPENLQYPAPATHLRDVWIALRMSLRHVLERITLDDVSTGEWPADVSALIEDPQAWTRRSRPPAPEQP